MNQLAMGGRMRDGNALDSFRIVAELLVVANHTAPLAFLDPTADFLLARVLSRVAVPFFLMVSGYFLLPSCLCGGCPALPARFLKRMGLLYLAAGLFYLPIAVYAGYFRQDAVLASLARLLVFDGMFYHLWYFPALILGVLLLVGLSCCLPPRLLDIVVVLLYLLGLLGDSYWGLARMSPALHGAYDAAFSIFSYTRNGIFFTPLFLLLGARLAEKPPRVAGAGRLCAMAGLLLLGMAGEALLLRALGWPRHNSSYLLLPLLMYFLFQALLALPGRVDKRLRDISLWLYLMHPFFILVVRGLVKWGLLPGAFIEHSLLHFVAVSLLSMAFSLAAVMAAARVKQRRGSHVPARLD